MNIGVIIIFHNNVTDINPEDFIENINSTEHIKMCLVDNESKDETLEKLLEIKEACMDKVSIVQIKKKVNRESAKRAGARYLFNDFDLKHIGFIDTNNLIEQNYNINEIVNSLCTEKDEIIAFNKEIKRKRHIKSTLFKSVFSLLEYFKNQDSDNNNIQQSLL
ncbi:family 2 glycosyl transferase [Ichthyenterobacterium sp. W332]|uniref:Family 2 glycosyl transferase n=1 Tax=Microcosmobacter mediterraneus TaxID=3075607 RepID=A0ABU2YMU7_9FLAO|nr:glycosyltransferase [Ichthyenterobacterium sp. W332]MDT0558989.1 family 2 glycosyl transferase [Ichthyenterobacterium sp. W332]